MSTPSPIEIIRLAFNRLSDIEKGNLIDSHMRGVRYLAGTHGNKFTYEGLG